jgi:hypothetical protein
MIRAGSRSDDLLPERCVRARRRSDRLPRGPICGPLLLVRILTHCLPEPGQADDTQNKPARRQPQVPASRGTRPPTRRLCCGASMGCARRCSQDGLGTRPVLTSGQLSGRRDRLSRQRAAADAVEAVRRMPHKDPDVDTRSVLETERAKRGAADLPAEYLDTVVVAAETSSARHATPGNGSPRACEIRRG